MYSYDDLISPHRRRGVLACRGDESAAALASEMPDFLWLLRDFQLELKDEGGRPITKDEYLDEALRPQRGTSAAAAELNATRAAIKTLFPRRASRSSFVSRL